MKILVGIIRKIDFIYITSKSPVGILSIRFIPEFITGIAAPREVIGFLPKIGETLDFVKLFLHIPSALFVKR